MNNSLPKVTICLQSFNCAPIIKYTLNSLINQDYPNFEILIFDDSSTDNTLEILSEYKKKYDFKFVRINSIKKFFSKIK